MIFTAVVYLISVLRYLDWFDMWITPPYTSHCIMTYQKIKYIFEIIPLNRFNVCWFSASGNAHTHMHSFKWFCSTTSVIFLISQYDFLLRSVTCAVELFTFHKSLLIHEENTKENHKRIGPGNCQLLRLSCYVWRN